MNDLAFILRFSPDYSSRFSKLDNLCSSLLNEVKVYKSKLREPPLNERPIKHIVYNERTNLRSIKSYYSKRVPINETLAAAKDALSLARYKPQSLYTESFNAARSDFGLAMLTFGFASLAALKIAFWDPLEWLMKGEVRSGSPLRKCLEELSPCEEHRRAYQRMTNQLLRRPFITEEVAIVFKELAPEADLLYLGEASLASEDITELAPYIEEEMRPGGIPVENYLKIMKDLYEKKQIEIHTLSDVKQLYESHNDILFQSNDKKHQSVEEFLKACCVDLVSFINPEASKFFPKVSPSALNILFEAALSSSTCQEMTLSKSLFILKPVEDFLKKNGYVIKEEHHESKKTYRRFPLE